jgi:hypothetical protein
MGKFIGPRATTAQREGITPDEGELIYDTDLNMFFSGDGATAGGVAIGAGASTALDNLASVAINESLISDTDNTDDLGSAAINWKALYVKAITTNSLNAVSFEGEAVFSDGELVFT